MADADKKSIPVNILTGFLGSGKTTVLNHIVKQPHAKSTAVIINEFGEIGIDHLLVETSTEQMVELNNGCICCTIRGDLSDKLGSLAMWLDSGKIPPVDRVIVETTGLADPAPIMHTLMTDENLLSRYRFQSVVTLVDAVMGESNLNRFSEAQKQIAIADHLIISKCDLIDVYSDSKAYERLKFRIRDLNARARIHEATDGVVDTNAFIRTPRDDVTTTFREFSNWLRTAGDEGAKNSCDHETHAHAHAHGSNVTSFVVELKNSVDEQDFNAFLQELAIDIGEHLLRMKGILNVSGVPDRPAVIHGVQHVFFPVTWLEKWPDDDRSTKLVFIVQGAAPEDIKQRFLRRFG